MLLVIQMHAVIKRIVWILQSSACNRILVFSTWRDVLSILEHTLTVNSIQCLHPRYISQVQSMLEDFNSIDKPLKVGRDKRSLDTLNTPAPSMCNGGQAAMQGKKHVGGEGKRVLLLKCEWSSEGLNLTTANHVLFVDPQLSPAVESQAVGRVFRYRNYSMQ